MTLSDLLIEYGHGRMTAHEVFEAHPLSIDGIHINTRGRKAYASTPQGQAEIKEFCIVMAVYGAFLNEFGCGPQEWQKQDERSNNATLPALLRPLRIAAKMPIRQMGARAGIAFRRISEIEADPPEGEPVSGEERIAYLAAIEEWQSEVERGAS